MSFADSAKKGSVELLLLTLLAEEDMYGYQIAQQLDTRSGGRYTLKESSMYPILYRMMDKKLISDRVVLVGKRRTRVYYHIEEKGRLHLREIQQEYLSLCSGILRILQIDNLAQIEEVITDEQYNG